MATAAVVLAGSALAPSAASAFAPKLDVSVDAARPSQTAKFTFAVTQPVQDPGSRHVLFAIPAGFTTTTPLSALTACDWPQEMVRDCPPQSRIGSVEYRAVYPGGTVPLDGGMYWGGAVRPGLWKLIVFLDHIGLNLHPQFEAYLQQRSGGGFDLTFDDLPTEPAQRFAVLFDGGRRAVLATPSRCGDYRFDGSFISRGEERASSSVTIPIRGCFVAPLRVTNLAIGKPVIRRHQRGTVKFHINRTARVRVIVRNAKGKTIQDRKVRFSRGDRVLSLGRDLHRGSYRIGLIFTATDGSYFTGKVALRVR